MLLNSSLIFMISLVTWSKLPSKFTFLTLSLALGSLELWSLTIWSLSYLKNEKRAKKVKKNLSEKIKKFVEKIGKIEVTLSL